VTDDHISLVIGIVILKSRTYVHVIFYMALDRPTVRLYMLTMSLERLTVIMV
jgi:hypothetical protein